MVIIGLNHKTAPIEIREKFFLNPGQQDLLLSELKHNPSITEAFVLSTCNRVEVYLKRVDDQTDISFLISLIAKIKKINIDSDHLSHLYAYHKEDALRHLLRVTTGIDSLILGEKQILGQVKSAVDRARAMGTLSKYFNILTNIAIRTGKKAQHETDISHGGASISWAAIEMAERTLGTIKERCVLVIGAGKMGELALNHLNNRGVAKIYIMNRTGEKAEMLAAKYNGISASFWDIKDILTEVDICFCAVGAPHYILDKEKIENIMRARQGRPLVIVDISMPRNIEPSVGAVPGVHLSSIDNLDDVLQTNMKKRENALAEVETIIQQKIIEFYDKVSKLEKFADSDFFKSSSSLD